MSDRTPTTINTAPESNTGLAMKLGEVKANLQHFTDETRDALGDLQTRLSSEEAAREALEDRLTNLHDIVSGHQIILNELTTWMESIAATKPQTMQKVVERDTEMAPARVRGESNMTLFKRLTTWASEQRIPAPPRPKGIESVNAYDTRVADFVKANVSEEIICIREPRRW